MTRISLLHGSAKTLANEAGVVLREGEQAI